jgi:hypothetical protein
MVIGLLPSQSAEAKAKRGRASAGSKEEQHACVAAYKTAKSHEKAGELRAARELLVQCAKPACNEFLRQECTTTYNRLESDIPSVIPVVTTEAGEPYTLADVRMDGELLTSKLDGKALSVDPGTHEFSFSTGSDVFASRKLLVSQGQRNLRVAVKIRSGGAKSEAVSDKPPAENIPEAAPTGVASAGVAAGDTGGTDAEAAGRKVAQASDDDDDAKPRLVARRAVHPARSPQDPARDRVQDRAESSSGPPVMAYVLGGVGLAGVAGYGLLTYWGKKDNDKLGTCAPMCVQSSVDHVHRLYVGANIALGAGLISLAASTWLFATSHGSSSEKQDVAASDPRKQSRIQTAFVDVLPTPSGAVATVGGSF